MCRAAPNNLSDDGWLPARPALSMELEKRALRTRKEVEAMQGILFMLGTVVIEGGLVALIMWLLTTGDREARREEEARGRLGELEGGGAGLRAGAEGCCRRQG